MWIFSHAVTSFSQPFSTQFRTKRHSTGLFSSDHRWGCPNWSRSVMVIYFRWWAKLVNTKSQLKIAFRCGAYAMAAGENRCIQNQSHETEKGTKPTIFHTRRFVQIENRSLFLSMARETALIQVHIFLIPDFFDFSMNVDFRKPSNPFVGCA